MIHKLRKTLLFSLTRHSDLVLRRLKPEPASLVISLTNRCNCRCVMCGYWRNEETVEVPAGKFDCMLYVVTGQEGGKPTKLSLYFAKTLAGPPVKIIKEKGGTIDATMVLAEHKVPAPAVQGL